MPQLLSPSPKARGKQIGDRKRYFDTDKTAELRRNGWGQIRIAKALGVGVGRVNQWVREEHVNLGEKLTVVNLACGARQGRRDTTGRDQE